MQYAAAEVGTTVHGATGADGSVSGPRLPRITVADESDELVDLLGEIFDGQFDVVAAAADALLNVIADTRPQLVVLNLWYPDAGRGAAVDLVRLIQRHRELWSIPIIGLTTERLPDSDDGHVFDSSVGIHVLAKPFALDALENLVYSLTTPVVGRDLPGG